MEGELWDAGARQRLLEQEGGGERDAGERDREEDKEEWEVLVEEVEEQTEE